MMIRILTGDCRETLKGIGTGTVQAAITSPPYWGLRDYNTPPLIWGGREDCPHEWGDATKRMLHTGSSASDKEKSNAGAFHGDQSTYDQFCHLCGAWRGSLGLEPTPALYVAHLAEVFREVKRVLRDDGVLWVVIGDSYASSSFSARPDGKGDGITGDKAHDDIPRPPVPPGLKPKDLCGIPWRVAFALQDDGWFLRQDVIWAKAISGVIRRGSAMPESVRDRFCKSHEYVFLLSKSARYFFDSYAVADVLDNDESHEYNTEYENKSMQQMWAGIAANDVQQEQPAQGRIDRLVQGVPGDSTQAVGPQVQRVGQGQSDSEAVLLFGEGASDQAGIQADVCTDARTKGTVSAGAERTRKDSEIQGANAKVLAESERQANQGEKGPALSEVTQGTLCQAEDGNQAQAPDESGGMHSDTSGVVGDSGTIQPSVCILRGTTGTPGNGSHHPGEQGGAAYSGERSPCMPDVQRQEGQQATATRRSVWLISPQPFSGAHFSTFPPDLVEPMIKAGTSERGCCPECGAAWERVVERTITNRDGWGPSNPDHATPQGTHGPSMRGEGRCGDSQSNTTGWSPTCDCDAGDPVPCTVLDPFGGSGTTGLVADRLGRDAILCELNPEYVTMSEMRIYNDAPLFAEVVT